MPEKSVPKTVAKKAPRKTVRKTVAKKTTTKTAPRKTVRRKASTSSESPRRAPTTIRREASVSPQAKITALIGLAIFFISIGAAAVLGFSDKGVVDVRATIAQRREQANDNERAAIDRVANADKLEKKTNGGLIASGIPVTPPPEPVVATSTASTTSATASTTNAIASSTEVVTEEVAETQETEAGETTNASSTATQ